MYSQEFLNSLCPAGFPPHKLKLKEKCSIMLMRNLDPKNGHVNGARYIVHKISKHLIVAAMASGPNMGKVLYLPRIRFVTQSSHNLSFEMCRKQFPVKLSFAITSNKAQGQTLQRVGIYISNYFFSHGKLYVALSRVGSRENIKVHLENRKFPNKKGSFTSNVVYPEIL